MAGVSDQETKAGTAAQGAAGGPAEAADRGPVAEAVQQLATATATWAATALMGKLGGVQERLTDLAGKGDGPGPAPAANGGGNGPGGAIKTLVKGAAGPALAAANPLKGSSGGAGRSGKQAKATNIIETIDVGVPVDLAYDLWTSFTAFPSFTKKVEGVEQESDEKLRWRVKILWSTREWESTIIEQVPDRRIIWRSEGAKGSVDGAVTFHEIGSDLTRILVVLEYHPQGFFERAGNLWRAQGRRARLELKNFRRHAMTEGLLHADEIVGWRGEIRDGEVVDTGEDDSPEGADAEEQQT
jgi:uncharacterized membrane protein